MIFNVTMLTFGMTLLMNKQTTYENLTRNVGSTLYHGLQLGLSKTIRRFGDAN
jgi:hypothetical protein